MVAGTLVPVPVQELPPRPAHATAGAETRLWAMTIDESRVLVVHWSRTSFEPLEAVAYPTLTRVGFPVASNVFQARTVKGLVTPEGRAHGKFVLTDCRSGKVC
jgi:hypothetical protein